jgi:hypothetical protein
MEKSRGKKTKRHTNKKEKHRMTDNMGKTKEEKVDSSFYF